MAEEDTQRRMMEKMAALAESLALRLAAVGASLAGDKALEQEKMDAEKIGRNIRRWIPPEKTD